MDRGRLLSESSTRAFAALRDRAGATLARLRVVAGAAFCLVTAVLALLGETDLAMSLWPLLAYVLVSWAAFRWTERPGPGQELALFSPLADVLFVFVLQESALAHGEQVEFAAGWTLGLYALLVAFSALSLRRRVIAATSAVAFALVALLQHRAGVPWTGIGASGVVLALAGVAAGAAVRGIDRVVAQLVSAEMDHEELRRAQTEAETLASMLVHDMKGPLTGMIGLAEVVASELSGPLKGDLKMIESQGRRLQTMVEDLLAIARLERGVLTAAPESVDLSAMLTAIANSYSTAAQQAGAQISARVESGLSATVHREMVHRLFDNLVLNALDYVRPGGRIEVSAWESGGGLRLAVRNTGEAVPPDARERLFVKGAQRGPRRKHNLGLGLYLCKLVAVAHDGIIELQDEPGWSTSFVARFPVPARVPAPPLVSAGGGTAG